MRHTGGCGDPSALDHSHEPDRRLANGAVFEKISIAVKETGPYGDYYLSTARVIALILYPIFY